MTLHDMCFFAGCHDLLNEFVLRKIAMETFIQLISLNLETTDRQDKCCFLKQKMKWNPNESLRSRTSLQKRCRNSLGSSFIFLGQDLKLKGNFGRNGQWLRVSVVVDCQHFAYHIANFFVYIMHHLFIYLYTYIWCICIYIYVWVLHVPFPEGNVGHHVVQLILVPSKFGSSHWPPQKVENSGPGYSEEGAVTKRGWWSFVVL